MVYLLVHVTSCLVHESWVGENGAKYPSLWAEGNRWLEPLLGFPALPLLYSVAAALFFDRRQGGEGEGGRGQANRVQMLIVRCGRHGYVQIETEAYTS